MTEPSFTETMQIGIVVPDLEAATQRYVDDHGIGPWEIVEFHVGEAEELHEHGQPEHWPSPASSPSTYGASPRQPV